MDGLVQHWASEEEEEDASLHLLAVVSAACQAECLQRAGN